MFPAQPRPPDPHRSNTTKGDSALTAVRGFLAHQMLLGDNANVRVVELRRLATTNTEPSVRAFGALFSGQREIPGLGDVAGEHLYCEVLVEFLELEVRHYPRQRMTYGHKVLHTLTPTDALVKHGLRGRKVAARDVPQHQSRNNLQLRHRGSLAC
eukprot:1063135-Prorocentrum_minimum.AAC.1